MRRLSLVIASILIVLALAACSSTPLFTMAGDYGVLLVVTESTNASATVGDVDGGLATVTTTDDYVEMDFTFILSGTRSGNSVTLTYSSGGDTFTMNLTWTSTYEFEGTGRIDYADDTYTIFTVDGQSTATPAAVGASGGIDWLH